MKNILQYDNYEILPNIKGPENLKDLSYLELKKLCEEIRRKIVYRVSKNGGHLASNLGVVELTVAIHKEFNSPKDKIIWDTGHQSYAHKLLTGRFNNFSSLRKKGGIAAFINPLESEHDIFISGHSSVSLSAACGIAKAELLKKTNNTVIAIIGDGALTGGIAYEALNNATDLNNLIIILNCNDMSISETVGSFSKYISNIRVNKTYISLNILARRFFEKLPLIGKFVKNTFNSSKNTIKKIVYKPSLFNELGYSFLNFVDGHNIKDVVQALKWAKQVEKPAIVRVFTKKGKGYPPAEKDPELYHGVGPFDFKSSVKKPNKCDFTTVFGQELCDLAEKDSRICAITAAMGSSTGLSFFKDKFKDRYFDVGIAEEHAVTFAAGLVVGGMIAVFAVYSTFLQRAYDQLIHDVSIQNTHLVLAIDRAGIVGSDGKTHQGIFDVAFLRTIPNIKIYSPATYSELKVMLKKSIYEETGLVAVRYPKGEEIDLKYEEFADYIVFGESKTAIVSYGRLFGEVLKAKKVLSEKSIDVSAVKLNKIYPISSDIISNLKKYDEIFFFEEGIKAGGLGEYIVSKMAQSGYKGALNLTAIDSKFVDCCEVEEAFKDLKLSSDSMVEKILKESIYISEKI